MNDDELWSLASDASYAALNSALGINMNSYQGASGPTTMQWAGRWTQPLTNLGGYYDSGRLDSLLGSLGGTSSDTYMNQLQVLSQEANKVYSLTQNPGQVQAVLRQAAQNAGGTLNLGFTGYHIADLRRNNSNSDYVADAMGNRYTDITMSPVFGMLYKQQELFSSKQNQIVQQLTAQQQREQSFVTQINQLTQTASLAKSKAEQDAATQALNSQYAQQQAALNQQAEANARQLAEQQRAQDAAYAEAQRVAEENRRQQQLALDTTAQTAAVKNATVAQQQQAKVAVSQAETQAAATRGGEAIVSTNAAASKNGRGTNTRTERWQSTRQPAPGGGGIRA